jgi:hypothetical protein
MDTKKGLLIIAIIFIIISAISCIFGHQFREIWPTTHDLYDMGIPYIVGALGVVFLGLSQVLVIIEIKRKNT